MLIRRITAAAFMLATLAAAQDEPFTFRTDVAYVAVDVQVLSRGKPVTGLRRDDFVLRDEGENQAIAGFGTSDQPLDVVLLLDISGSMRKAGELARMAAADALGKLHVRDRVSVVVFNTRQYLIAPLSSDWALIQKELAFIPWDRPGGTVLNQSVYATAKYLRSHARPDARRAIVMVTDNVGRRAISDAMVRDELWEADAVFNLLLFPASVRSQSADDADVRKFARDTGGDKLDAGEMDVRLAEMFDRMRKRYAITYRAPEAPVGSVRKIRVDLTRGVRRRLPDLTIRARTGYVAGTGGDAPRVAMRPQ
jgi:VWFA-related protein